jgi:glyoxylase-like metal-dependent hydrolase (beta-lactamase superfamily II)
MDPLVALNKLIIHVTGNAWSEICRNTQCPLCYGSDRPLNGRGNTSLSLLLGAAHLLIDTGAGCHLGIRRAQLEPPNAVLLTHSHPDHLNQMELDTVLRDVQLTGRPEPLLVASERTWQDISKFHQNQLEFFKVEAGQEIALPGVLSRIRIEALDAGDHWRGGLNFIISAGSFRFGALFDRKTWNSVGVAAENLDLAVIEANSIRPMSAKTGHTSLAETLNFLRLLSRAPRLSLLIHMGHDDIEQLSMGSLEALTRGLAPDLAVRWAYPGMTISASHLPPNNPVAILDELTNMVVGVGAKAEVHAQGSLHGSVLLLVSNADGRIVLYRRHAEQTYPNCLDVFGGHYEPADAPEPRKTAWREMGEEIRFVSGALRVQPEPQWLVPLSAPFAMESMDARNRERSTLFGIRLPQGVTAEAEGDITDSGRAVPATAETLGFAELLALAESAPQTLADGLARVVAAARQDGHLRQRIESFLQGEL